MQLSTSKSIANPGYNVTAHPKPEGYTPIDWIHMVKCYHTSQGHIVKECVTFSNPIYDDPDNPMYRKEIDRIWGVEAIWSTR